MPDVPTEELVAAARGGDDLAYDRLFERVGERLLLFVRCRLGRALGERVDPLDVVQETYLEAHRSFADFQDRGRGAFTRWLCAIADHRIQDLAKHHGARKRVAPGGALVRGSTALARLRASHTGPATHLARREREEALCEAVEALPADEREALLQRFFQGRTLEEIAAALHTSERSVRRLLGKAMARVGDRLLPEEEQG